MFCAKSTTCGWDNLLVVSDILNASSSLMLSNVWLPVASIIDRIYARNMAPVSDFDRPGNSQSNEPKGRFVSEGLRHGQRTTLARARKW